MKEKVAPVVLVGFAGLPVIVVFGCGGVDRPRERGGGEVGVAGGVGCAHVEGVRAVAEAAVDLRAGAGDPGAAVEAHLEGRSAVI